MRAAIHMRATAADPSSSAGPLPDPQTPAARSAAVHALRLDLGFTLNPQPPSTSPALGSSACTARSPTDSVFSSAQFNTVMGSVPPSDGIMTRAAADIIIIMAAADIITMAGQQLPQQEQR